MKSKHAMIGNLFFGPLDVEFVRETKKKIFFKRKDNNLEVSFDKSDVGVSLIVAYYAP